MAEETRRPEPEAAPVESTDSAAPTVSVPPGAADAAPPVTVQGAADAASDHRQRSAREAAVRARRAKVLAHSQPLPGESGGGRALLGLGLLIALAVVLIYVGMRFQFKFGIASVVPLAHDVLIVLGIFALFQWTFDLSVLAALLAVIGYSLNDTIVVADRIRENFRRVRKATPLEIVNISLTETLGRTLVTSLTTLLVLSALALFGGEMIFGFAVALLVGVAVGTYSSIYVAATTLLALGVSKDDVAVVVKEGAEQDDGLP